MKRCMGSEAAYERTRSAREGRLRSGIEFVPAVVTPLLRCTSRGSGLLLGRHQFLEPGVIDVLHLAIGQGDEALAVPAGLLVSDYRGRGAADPRDGDSVTDDERLLVARGDERRIDRLGVHAIRAEDVVRKAAQVFLELRLAGGALAVPGDRTIQVQGGESA